MIRQTQDEDMPDAYFTESLRTEQIGHQTWKVIRGFAFQSKTGRRIYVPKGFQCDLASIPSVLQSFVSKVGYWSQGAVVHDLLYFNHRNGYDNVITRLEADRLLREACTVRANDWRVPRNERKTALIYRAVRAGGLLSWETPDERDARIDKHIEDVMDG